ncbi:MAG: acyl-CoA dehydrogenase [Alphaproteobacteria bacterium]|nr:acyl-CoA dehydrogenase [Alphaproteobacteria bacterium]
MDFTFSERVQALYERVAAVLAEAVYPAEATFAAALEADGRWSIPPILPELQARARAAGLWNLFLPDPALGSGLNNLDYAPLCELMGRSPLAPHVFNCNAPDTGNMEVLWRFGTAEQKARWLTPLLNAEIRSAIAMTEPGVASSDPTSIVTRIERAGDSYLVNGRKWWITNAAHPDCRLLIVMGRSNPAAPRHRQHSMILVPMDAPGVRIVRRLTLFGYDDAPFGHCEIALEDVRVPEANLVLGEGRGFEIAQARLGPGRIHHCMRLIGAAERALAAMCRRAASRVAFGKALAEQGSLRELIALSRIEIEQARLLVLKTADRIDREGAKAARAEIAMIKVAVPRMAQAVLDRAMQVHGAGGFTEDFGLAQAWANARSLRMADGPDAVHLESVAKLELARHAGANRPPVDAPGGAP